MVAELLFLLFQSSILFDGSERHFILAVTDIVSLCRYYLMYVLYHILLSSHVALYNNVKYGVHGSSIFEKEPDPKLVNEDVTTMDWKLLLLPYSYFTVNEYSTLI